MVKFQRYQPPYDSDAVPKARIEIYNLYRVLDRNDEATRWAQEQVVPGLKQEINKRAFLTGRDTPESLTAAASLAEFYRRTEQLADALQVIEETLERGMSKGWPLNAQSLFSMLDKSSGWPLAMEVLEDVEKLGQVAHDCGRSDLAVSLATDVQTQVHKISEAPKSLPAKCEFLLGYFLLLQQKPEQAELHLQEALKLQSQHDPNSSAAAKTRLQLGTVLLEVKNYAAAETQLVTCYEQLKGQDRLASQGETSQVPQVLERLIELYMATGDSEKLEEYRRLKADLPPESAQAPKEES